MRFSKKSRYGLRALIDLALSEDKERVALSSIAERNRISLQYLEQVFASLRRAGIVRSIKGAQGGYLLNDSAENISVAQIIRAVDGSYLLEDEAISGESDRITMTVQRKVIDEVNDKLDELLCSISLADLAEDCLEQTTQEYMYFI
jgi:Rrf2 family protein